MVSVYLMHENHPNGRFTKIGDEDQWSEWPALALPRDKSPREILKAGFQRIWPRHGGTEAASDGRDDP